MDVLDEVLVATDEEEVRAVVERAGGRAVLTSPHHETGTERVAEVARRPEFEGYDVIVNLQGDEPFLPDEAVRGAVARVRAGDDVGSAAAPLPPEAASDPARVKVVTDERGRALYFSRALIPFVRQNGAGAGGGGGEGGAAPLTGLYWQHLGVYAYARSALRRWVELPAVPLERAERLEQLRALYHGLTIGIARLDGQAAPGIDTPEDLRRAETLWQATHGEGGNR